MKTNKLIIGIVFALILFSSVYAIGGLTKNNATIELDKARYDKLRNTYPNLTITKTECSEVGECLFAINQGDSYYKDIHFTINETKSEKQMEEIRNQLISQELQKEADRLIKEDLDRDSKRNSDKLGDGSITLREKK